MEEIIVTQPEETTVEEVVETTEVKTEPEVKTEIPTIDPEQQVALDLFKALRDPSRAGSTLQQLADMAGLDLVKKQDRQELKKDIKTLVKERLGEDNSILADSLGPLLEELLEGAVKDKLKPLEDSIFESKKIEFSNRIENEISALDKETKGLSSKLESRMVELMGEISPGETTPPEKYIRHIFKLAKSEFDEAERVKAQNTKQTKNKETVSVQTGVNADRVKSGSKLPTIREAVAAAVRGETLE